MGTWNAFYVKAKTSQAAQAIQERFAAARIDSSGEFMGVRMPDEAFEPPESELAELSKRLETDAIWLGFQSAVDAFQFHHWLAGKRLRSLVFGCFGPERTWERAEGNPEPWERDTFFDPRFLEIPLEYAASEQEKQELSRIWREAEILPGREEPSLDSRGCAHKIARYYHLPHYGL
jgi:hypothetical protein